MLYRIEKDALGEKKVPADAYYGVQTERAIENFPISGIKAHPEFIRATVHVKRAAARVHQDLKLLESRLAKAIISASDEILSGQFMDQFVVDIYQAGAGTSHNMNTNEVIANRANEILGEKKGSYQPLHPNDHVNMAQSTNDVIPTAIRIAALGLVQELIPTLGTLAQSFQKKAKEFDHIIKSGRTHLQDAVPIRLGQEFGAYAVNILTHQNLIREASELLKNLGLGGSAVGTGLNTHPEYRVRVAKALSEQTKLPFKPAKNYFETMQSLAPFTNLSSALRNFALDMIRIANDLRLMTSGPRVGFGEIVLPPVQPGSSIMPGKVNPVMAEMLNMLMFQVIGNDTAIMMASQAGQLELNVMMPLVAYLLPQTLEILKNSLQVFSEKCVLGLEADKERCRHYAELTPSIITALSPFIGYSKSAELFKESLKRKVGVRELVIEKGLMTREKLEKVLDLKKLTEPGIPGKA
ncbi:MAG: aspartate ammonia-lyase [Chlamydiae bacterium]|nr:aspartate ammonia-lyase [Chlamydiota bacterium]MBI3267333.1 aspartate ammonia-lyase [Chlamydiota bacterium]